MARKGLQLNADQLGQLEEFGRLQFTPLEAAIAMDLAEHRDEIGKRAEDMNDPIGQAFKRGQLLALAEVRRKILEQAKQGSNPAQTLYLKAAELREKAQRRGE